MQKRKCQTVNLELSVVGTGCWTFGGGEYWGDQSQKDVNEVVHASVDLGINYFDTAEAYNGGRSEESLGEAIKGISRDKLVIGSKVSPSNCYKDTLIKHCEASLKRLDTDYIDLYMIHWPIHPRSIMFSTRDQKVIENPPTIDEAIEALRILKQHGKIREFGISNFGCNKMRELPIQEIAANQLPYNLLCRAIEYDTLPFCQENGIGIIGYMALMQGILADAFPSLDDVPVWRRRTRHFNSENNKECRHEEAGAEEETNAALEGIRNLCKETGHKMMDLALQWIFANPALTCILVGSRNVKQLEANVNAIREPLHKDLKDQLDQFTLPLMEKLGNHLDYFEGAKNDRTI
ncbi:aldo/keto reductase [Fulvivirgaceae bacterium BMA12]|uniref:Aldo/keto reductase n=1 Tax=Agaribacillus aureus TaxID=3051825 RepID=A0ABT8L1F8_9BACT|nr:aldo/keto reductase [Fulvivirgaceae bacterium BMA12]